jgi:hypothetical protein
MALAKTKSTNFGVDTTYHKLGTINISWHFRTCFVDVFSYLNQDTREQEKSPLSTSYHEFTEDNFTFDITGNISEQVYEKLKRLPEWQDATDC